MTFKIKDGLTFDDLLLEPKFSEITSRSNVSLSIHINKLNITYKHPIIPANMKDVIGLELAECIYLSGGLGILHRFMPLEDQIEILHNLEEKYGFKVWSHIGFSIGVKKEDYANLDYLVDHGAKIICIDIAHGHSKMCIDMCHYISGKYPEILLIAGNVATEKGAYQLYRAGADVVKIGVGGGCFAAGTRILMSSGFYKNIEDVEIGDFVINKDGKSVEVIDSFSTGFKKVSKIKNNIFYEDTFVTPDHQFWVGDLNSVHKNTITRSGYRKLLDKKSKTKPKISKYKWKKLSDIKQDVLLMPKEIKFNLKDNFEIHLQKKIGGNWRVGTKYETDCIIRENYESGYLFGTFLGDGCANCAVYKGSHIGSVRWYFGANELYIAEKLSKCIEFLFGKIPNIKKHNNIIEVIFYYKPLADYLYKWGKRDKKALPESLLVSSKEYLQGLYDGLLDSDGHYAKDGRLSISNTSVKIIELFNILCYLLTGLFANNSKKQITGGKLQNCNLNNCKQSYYSRTLKNGKIRLTKNYNVVKILDYQELNEEKLVYDLTVNCDTHSFIANNMIVHNSTCSTRVETGNGVPQMTALMECSKGKENAQMFYGKNKQLFLISDGGIKEVGDIGKALCIADMAMLGGMFARCRESAGKFTTIDGVNYKEYAGSSTYRTEHVEGVKSLIKAEGSFAEVLTKMKDGLTSCCAYQGVGSVEKLKDNPIFVKMTSAGLRESHPHDVMVIKGEK